MSEDRVRDRSPVNDRKEGGGRRDRNRRSGFGQAGKGRRAPPERRIFISNIPFEMKWQEVKDMFRDEVGEVAYVELFNDENDKPRGCGILEFANEDLVKQAVEKMHRKDLKGRKLVVKEDFDSERDKFGRIINGGGRRGGGGGGDRDRDRDRDRGGNSMSGGGAHFGNNTYGLSPQFLESLGIDGPLHNRLFIANLSYAADEKKLREVFRLAGRVVTAELNRDKDGKSRGHAVVEYDHPVEAVQAISMLNNQVLLDRKMTVRFDKQPGPSPEELSQLPSRLPEGLNGVGMGLGSGGNPLTDVAKNLPNATGSGSSSGGGATQMQQAAPQQQPQQQMMGGAGGGMGDAAGASNLLGGLNELSALSVLTRQLAGGGGQDLLSALSSLGNAGTSNQASQGMSNMGGGGGAGGAGGMAGGMGGGSMGGAPNMGGASGMGGGNMGGGSMGGAGSMGMSGGMGGMGGMNNGSMGGGRSGGAGGSGMGGMGGMGGSQGAMGDPRAQSGYSTSGTAGGYGGGAGGGSDMSDMMGGRSGGGGGGSSVRQSDTVTVRNLPPDCNWQVLREGFAHCGEIKYAEMKDRGTGMIRFMNERDAERAVSMMNNQTIAGRTIEVRLY